MLTDPQTLWGVVAQLPTMTVGRSLEPPQPEWAEDPNPKVRAAYWHLTRLEELRGRVFLRDGRHWTVTQFFMPLTRDKTVRSGVRARVVDETGFISFVNQRDLEVLLQDAAPGSWCSWLGTRYPDPDGPGFFGCCCDAQDLLDDLYAVEIEQRYRSPNGVLPNGLSYERWVHRTAGNDVRQVHVLLWDMDPATGVSPDMRFESVEQRWRLVEEERVVRR